MYRLLLAVFLLLPMGCYAVLQDRPADMRANTTPDALLHAEKPAPPVSQLPALDVTESRRVGWVPRHATPAGDIIEGHSVEITPRALVPEQVQPLLFVPRAPRFAAPGTVPQKTRTSPVPPAPPVPPDVAPPTPGALPMHPLLQGGGHGLVTP